MKGSYEFDSPYWDDISDSGMFAFWAAAWYGILVDVI